MADLRSRLPAQSLMERTLELHPPSFYTPSGDALSWYRGALGEIAVAGVLAWLDDDWTVLHSVPVGTNGTDIDHVVIGPPGAFTINTKSHPRQDLWIAGYGLLVDGHRTNYVTKAGAEAERTGSLLTAAVGFTVPVTPLIVFVNPGRRVTKAAPEHGVQVLADWELLEFLRGQRHQFSPDQVQRIAYAGVRPATWNAPETCVLTDRRVAIHFNAMVARSLQGAQPQGGSADAPTPAPNRHRPVSLARTAVPARPSGSSRRSNRRRKSASAFAPFLRLAVALGAMWFVIAVALPATLGALTP